MMDERLGLSRRFSGRGSSGPTVAIVGGSLRAASILRLLSEVENVKIAAVASPALAAPAARLAEDLGVFVTADFREIFQLAGLDLILDMSEDEATHLALQSDKPADVEMVGTSGSELVWDLLVAKKRGEEQEKLFAELQVAYDQIRSHERRLQSGKQALEETNQELEARLAEIFFTHEFFKALTKCASVDEVCSLIVDGANGILGAEISCVYLFERSDWTLRLRASQGRPSDAFEPVVSVGETIVGVSFREGMIQQPEIGGDTDSVRWMQDTTDACSQVAVALKSGEQVLGVMVVASATLRVLAPAELDRLQVIANQSSLALQNALLNAELERLSVTDLLTDLFNHGYFQQRLDMELRRATRFGHPLTLVMLDIDNFKALNDTYGHPRGDAVLKVVSAIIRENLRDIDIAARYGGEEFVMLLPETDTEGGAALAERVRARIESEALPISDAGAAIHISISLGVATYPVHAESAADLIDMADRALYQAKARGKNQVVVAG